MNNPHKKPGRKELRAFGLAFGILFALVFGGLIPLIRQGPEVLVSPQGTWPFWPWLMGASVIIWSLFHARSLIFLHKPWMKFAEIAGWINTRIIMVLLFFGLIMPIGLIMRLFGYDPMRRKIDNDLETYRIIRQPQNKQHMKHPY